MAVGHMINLNTTEVYRLLRLWTDWNRYHTDNPFASKFHKNELRELSDLMDHFARWLVLCRQEGRADGASQATRETWEQLAFPSPTTRLGGSDRQ